MFDHLLWMIRSSAPETRSQNLSTCFVQIIKINCTFLSVCSFWKWFFTVESHPRLQLDQCLLKEDMFQLPEFNHSKITSHHWWETLRDSMQYSFCVADKAEEAGPRIYIPESRDIVSVISISEIGPIAWHVRFKLSPLCCGVSGPSERQVWECGDTKNLVKNMNIKNEENKHVWEGHLVKKMKYEKWGKNRFKNVEKQSTWLKKVNMKKWKKSWRNEKKKIEMKKKQVWERWEGVLLVKGNSYRSK